VRLGCRGPGAARRCGRGLPGLRARLASVRSRTRTESHRDLAGSASGAALYSDTAGTTSWNQWLLAPLVFEGMKGGARDSVILTVALLA